MNPATLNDSRPVIWTISESDTSLYCLYIGGRLYSENLTLDEFYPIYKKFSA